MSNQILKKFAPEGFPADWRQMRIGEAIEAVSSPVEMHDNDEYLLASIRRRFGGMFHRERLYGRQILTKNLQRVIPGTFIIARMQIVHGACALADEQFQNHVISKSYSSFKGTRECDIRFFSKLAEQPFMTEYFRQASHGVVIEKMTFQQARWLDFPILLPPLDEQQRIVEILDTIDIVIRAMERIVAKLQTIRDGVIRDQLSALLGLPMTAVTCLGVEVSVGIVVRPAQYYTPDGIPVLRSANVREGKLDMTNLVYMSPRSHRMMAKTALYPGDLLTVRTGYPGTTAVVPSTVGEANCVDVIITKTGTSVDPEFLSLWINSEFGKGHVLARQGGLAQQHFNISDMKTLPVPVVDSSTQRELVEGDQALRSRLDVEQAGLTKLRLLRTGLATDLLTGRVRTVTA